MMNRFIFMCVSFIICHSSCNSVQKKIEDNYNHEFIDLFSVKDQPNISCYRIPSMVTATNGDVLAAIDERGPSCRDLKWNDDINLVMRRSTDNGASWSPIRKILDYPLGISASDPSMIVDNMTGDIFLFYNYMNRELEQDVYYIHFMKSTDHGISWESPVDISAQITKPEWQNDFKFVTSGRGTQLKDGTLLHCLVNLDKGMHVFGSKNNGLDWFLIDRSILPANESKIIELSDGRWLINSRIEKKGMRFVHVSEDNGQTWKSRPDELLTDPSCNASIIIYKKDKRSILIFSNASHPERRENMTIRLSYDEGLTWPVSKMIYKGSAAYSTMTVLKNGDIGLLFEMDDYSKNTFVRLTLEWLES